MKRKRNDRQRRNSQCHCGSGKKVKHCHGVLTQEPSADALAVELKPTLGALSKQETQRKQQQGHGRPIIGVRSQEDQIIAVGGRLYAGPWKTFVDFLSDYIVDVLGRSWFDDEKAKSPDKQHKILQLHASILRHRETSGYALGDVRAATNTAATAAYFGLAYNLYLLAHNAEIQSHLITRLKNSDQFRGAYYETFVAAWFILAGFSLKLENEQQGDTTHCEFTATHKLSKMNYSVEAKSRAPGKLHADVGNQLHAALGKKADYTRIVFIDINLQILSHSDGEWARQVRDAVKGREDKLKINGEPAPPAYVVVTNYPYFYDLERIDVPFGCVCTGFRMPNFGQREPYQGLAAQFTAFRKHSDILAILNACREYEIPSTFDGVSPEVAFRSTEPQFVVGKSYDLSASSPGAIGQFESGIITNDGRDVFIALRLEDGTKEAFKFVLNDEGVAAYKAAPLSLFGMHNKMVHKGNSAMDLFEFFYDTYREVPKGRLLEIMKTANDIEELSQLTDEEVLLVYCERRVGNSSVFGQKVQDKKD